MTNITPSKNVTHPKIILLDVYETILDMSEIERKVNLLMKSKRGYVLWFELFMQYSFADNCSSSFHDFQSIAEATLRMTSYHFKTEMHNDEVNTILELMKHLPLKENVQTGLTELYEQQYRIAALTNSPAQIVINRMERTGLISYFELVISAEEVRKYKPAKEVYLWAAKKLQTPPEEILLTSAHGWDIAGAKNAGMQTAYLSLPNQLLYPLAPQPDYTCSNLTSLAAELLQSCDNKK
ncbi:MAG TPA: haloacid dehalogenase type II [Chitinophagaceae bacterium]|nr:haloacid dehalogenase type II [Chitinophagaceae bacterium]